MRYYSVVLHLRHLKGHPGWGPSLFQALDGAASLLSSCLCWHVGREAMVLAPSPPQYSAVSPCFPGSLAFPHRHFPPGSPPLHPLGPSPSSQQKLLSWDYSTNPMLHLPAVVPSRGPVSLPGVCMAVARTVWFSFHLGCHRSAASLSASNVSPLT